MALSKRSLTNWYDNYLALNFLGGAEIFNNDSHIWHVVHLILTQLEAVEVEGLLDGNLNEHICLLANATW